ncbi:MAG: nuclear transport factor 2 family protein [Acidimicrobiales bacterium]
MATTEQTYPVIDRFLAGVEAGRLPDDLYAPDATLDATVPGWRFQAHGTDAIIAEYARWFSDPSRLRSVERQPIPFGEVVRYVQVAEAGATAYTVHHMHLLTVADDQIVKDVVFCGGRWGSEALAQMGSAAHAD